MTRNVCKNVAFIAFKSRIEILVLHVKFTNGEKKMEELSSCLRANSAFMKYRYPHRNIDDIKTIHQFDNL